MQSLICGGYSIVITTVDIFVMEGNRHQLFRWPCYYLPTSLWDACTLNYGQLDKIISCVQLFILLK